MDDITRLRERATRRIVNQTQAATGLPNVRVSVPESSAKMWENLADYTEKLSKDIEKEEALQKATRLAQIEVDADIAATRLRNQFEYNPSGFEEAWDEYSANTLLNVEGDLVDPVRIALGKQFAGTLGVIQNEARARSRQLAADTLTTKAEALQNKLLNMAFDNETADPIYEATFSEYASVLKSSANLGLRSKEAIDIELDAFSDQLKAEAVVGNVGAIYEEKGFDAAKAALIETVGNENFNFSPEHRAALMRRGLSVITELETENEKRIVESNKANKAALDLRISRLGTPLEQEGESVDRVYLEIQDAKYLTPTEKSDYIQLVDKTLIKKIEDTQGLVFVEQALQGGGFDNLNPDHKKHADAYFNQNVLPAVAEKPLSEFFDAAIEFTNKTQYIPEAAQTRIRGMLFTGTPEQQVVAADFVQKVAQTAPVALSQLGEKAIEKADFLQNVASLTGSPEEALNLYNESIKVTPAVKQFREQIIKDEEHPKKNRSFLKSKSDFSFDAGLGFGNASVPDDMEAEYNALQKRLYLNTGNYEASRESAWKMLTREWGITGLSGGARWMKYAPEAYLGNNAGDWLKEQLAKDVKEHTGREIDVSRLRIISDEITARTVDSGVLSYQVMEINEDGVPEPIFNRNVLAGPTTEGWSFNYEQSDFYKRKKIEERAALEAGEYGRNLRKEARKDAQFASPQLKAPVSATQEFVNFFRTLGYQQGAIKRMEDADSQNKQ